MEFGCPRQNKAKLFVPRLAVLLLAISTAASHLLPSLLPGSDPVYGDGLIRRQPEWTSRRSGRVRRATGDCSKPVVNGLRFVQSGTVPVLSTGSGGALTIAMFEEGDSRAAVAVEVYGECLQDVTELALTLTPTSNCESRIGPYYPDLDRDLNSTGNASATVRSFVLDLAGTQQPKFSTTYYLCAGSEESGLTNQGEAVQVRFVLTTNLLPQWAVVVIVIALLVLSGLFSGLNLGLMSLDPVELKVIMQSGSETEKKYARTIEPLRRHGNYLLCTILLGNVVVNATLTNLLDSLTGSGAIAVIASSGGIVVFGEILPQSVCSRYGLAVGAKTIWITRFFMVVTFPLAFPISFILDKILGREIGRVFKREELIKLVQVTRDHHDMAEDELEMLTGVLQYKKKTIMDVMTPKADMFVLDESEILSFDTLRMIQAKGHSRIPVHYQGDENDIIGVMFVKDLMFVDPDDKWPVSHIVKVYKHPVLQTNGDTKLDVMLEQFKTGVSHMSLVTTFVCDEDKDPYYKTIGIVTLEDIIEEIIKTEIVDETDQVRDNITKEPVHRTGADSSATMVVPVPEETVDVNISEKLLMQAHNYLRSSFEQYFSVSMISDDKLARLVGNRDAICTIRVSSRATKQVHHYIHRGNDKRQSADSSGWKKSCLYNADERSDKFVLILEGRVEVSVGGFEFEKGAFDSFGEEVLEEKKRGQFVPNYTVRALTDVTYIKITADMYHRACHLSITTPQMGRGDGGVTPAASVSSMISAYRPGGAGHVAYSALAGSAAISMTTQPPEANPDGGGTSAAGATVAGGANGQGAAKQPTLTRRQPSSPGLEPENFSFNADDSSPLISPKTSPEKPHRSPRVARFFKGSGGSSSEHVAMRTSERETDSSSPPPRGRTRSPMLNTSV